ILSHYLGSNRESDDKTDHPNRLVNSSMHNIFDSLGWYSGDQVRGNKGTSFLEMEVLGNKRA
ncbi:MAG: hypothetical protein QNL64_02270, partial [Porticoccus sp.]